MSDRPQDPRKAARESYSGHGLTDSQFEESYAIAGVIERGIRKSGSFHEKLTDYAHAFARSERFDAMRGEAILRDIFKGRFGETPNAMRERLLAREDQLRQTETPRALEQARSIGPMIREGETRPFYQAYDRAAVDLARGLDITERGAKEMMQESFERVEGRDLYSYGKALEEEHHRPRREAERERRRQGSADELAQPRSRDRRR